jgi:Haloacid dehalogenase-like hydrolase
MSRSVRAALFDVDGTLVDTNYLHAVTWWEAFAQAGYQPPMADIHRAIGMGSDQMLDKLLPADRDRAADADMRAAQSTRPPSPGMSSPASPPRTWWRRHWTGSACRRTRRYSPVTRSGTYRRARRPGFRVSAC